MNNLLVSFCNIFPPNLALAIYNLKDGSFNWIFFPQIKEKILGATGICFEEDSYFVLLQMGNNRSLLVRLDINLVPQYYYNLKALDAHSIIFYNDSLFIVNSAKNGINRARLDNSKNILREEEYWRYSNDDNDLFHVNSIAEMGGDLYVSMFGLKDQKGWLYSQSGKIINISKNEVVYDGLFHPHSLRNINGVLYFLESRRGLVHTLNLRYEHKIFMNIEGYLRGIAGDNNFIYVGVSASRRRSKSTGTVNTLPNSEPDKINSFIYCVEMNVDTVSPYKKVLTAFGKEIYDLQLLDSKSCYELVCKKEDAIMTRINSYEDEYFCLSETSKRELAEKENELAGVRIELARKETELETILNSTTWRIIQKYLSLVKKLTQKDGLHGRIFRGLYRKKGD